MVRVILASKSPWRKILLKKLIDDFEVIPSHIDENIDAQDTEEYVTKLSYLKAKAVADQLEDGIVIGSDTVVEFEGEIIGKPRDKEHAYELHRRMSGKTHRLLSGLTLIDAASSRCLTECAITKVTLGKYTDDDIRPYIESGDPLTAAGAYVIDPRNPAFDKFVEKVEGDYYNTYGLPLHTLKGMLEKFGVKTASL